MLISSLSMRSRVDFVRSSTSAALRWAVGMGGRTRGVGMLDGWVVGFGEGVLGKGKGNGGCRARERYLSRGFGRP